eukprot:TRINITY_DN16354_c0_g1_i1.p1 TRINITY_DN16354_c0_g1~~TRINITY_DN16354_c0_g1_i1.p1  ORF type:complete len:280 (+),score=65.30 TRINITY_DN16354_c0_g1_i1:35-841(+)
MSSLYTDIREQLDAELQEHERIKEEHAQWLRDVEAGLHRGKRSGRRGTYSGAAMWWGRLVCAAEKDMEEGELVLVSLETLQTLIQHYGFNKSEANHIEEWWWVLQEPKNIEQSTPSPTAAGRPEWNTSTKTPAEKPYCYLEDVEEKALDKENADKMASRQKPKGVVKHTAVWDVSPVKVKTADPPSSPPRQLPNTTYPHVGLRLYDTWSTLPVSPPSSRRPPTPKKKRRVNVMSTPQRTPLAASPKTPDSAAGSRPAYVSPVFKKAIH